jgi:transposase-like protein
MKSIPSSKSKSNLSQEAPGCPSCGSEDVSVRFVLIGGSLRRTEPYCARCGTARELLLEAKRELEALEKQLARQDPSDWVI